MLKLTAALLALVAVPAAAQPLTPAEQARDRPDRHRDARRRPASLGLDRDRPRRQDRPRQGLWQSVNDASPARRRPALPDRVQLQAVHRRWRSCCSRTRASSASTTRSRNTCPGITGGDRITIRQLLSHTSGLQDYWPQDYSFAAMAHADDAAGDRRSLGEEAARFRAGHAVAIFEHRLCRRRHDRREGQRASRC